MRRSLLVVALALALTGAGAFGLTGGPEPAPVPASAAPDPAALSGLGSDTLAGALNTLQDHLRTQPRDAHSWAVLGLAYVEQARLTGDPTYYPRARRVLARSLREQPSGNDVALAGQSALLAAQHRFAAAGAAADRALAVNPYQPTALAVRTDALVELGRYTRARRAALRADRIRPTLSTFARMAYLEELHGRLRSARDILGRAADAALAPADQAFVHSLLADLARREGRLAAAAGHLRVAQRAEPAYGPAMASRARLLVARGRLDAAVGQWRAVVSRQPTPEYLLELGEALQATGRVGAAQRQYDVLRTVARLARDNGVVVDLELALFLADHGAPARALAAARAEWDRRHSIHVADALGWAWHRAGEPTRALPYLRTATRLGTDDARLLYHRGMVEATLGRPGPARTHLRAALAADPGFAPLSAAAARRTLNRLDGS